MIYVCVALHLLSSRTYTDSLSGNDEEFMKAASTFMDETLLNQDRTTPNELPSPKAFDKSLESLVKFSLLSWIEKFEEE